MRNRGWLLIVIAVIILIVDVFTLGNRQVIDNPMTNQLALAIALICILLFFIGVFKTIYDFFSRRKKANKFSRLDVLQSSNYIASEPTKKIKPKKKWQPINIILGLLMIGFVIYFNEPTNGLASIVAYSRLIPAIALIFTKKNNIFTLLLLILFGVTIFVQPTADAYIYLVSIIYMFISIVLSLFKVKWHSIVGLLFALAICFSLLWENSNIVVSEHTLNVSKDLNSQISIVLVNETGKESTSFNANRTILAKGMGLEKGVKYAYRIIYAENLKGDPNIAGIGKELYSLDNWPIFKAKGSGDISQRGIITRLLSLKGFAIRNEFNRANQLPLSLGSYAIQLIEIDEPNGIIVAENNFSIVAFDKDLVSKLIAYITVEGDSTKYYDTYTRKGPEGISVWVQAPKGEVISGIVKNYISNEEGIIDQYSWIGVTENAFTTNGNGEPVGIWGLSGNPLPGIYHYEIIVDGETIFNLKYKI